MGDESGARRRVARRTLILLALVCAAPVVASYVAYYWVRPAARVNYGELEAKPAPAIAGSTADGTPWRLDSMQGRWILLVVTGSACDSLCERALYATRQARAIQGREQDRVARALLLPVGVAPPPEALLAQHPGLIVAQADPRQWTPALGAAERIHVLDPLGNLVLTYPADPDIRRLAKDLERLLKASRIG